MKVVELGKVERYSCETCGSEVDVSNRVPMAPTHARPCGHDGARIIANMRMTLHSRGNAHDGEAEIDSELIREDNIDPSHREPFAKFCEGQRARVLAVPPSGFAYYGLWCEYISGVAAVANGQTGRAAPGAGVFNYVELE